MLLEGIVAATGIKGISIRDAVLAVRRRSNGDEPSAKELSKKVMLLSIFNVGTRIYNVVLRVEGTMRSVDGVNNVAKGIHLQSFHQVRDLFHLFGLSNSPYNKGHKR